MYRLTDLKSKEVINICDGSKLGHIYDCEFETNTGKICAFIAKKSGFVWRIFCRFDEFVIPWNSVETIGEDVILVKFEFVHTNGCKKNGFFKGIFE